MSESLPSVALTTSARRNLVGIALTVSAVLCFSCLDASAKWLNQSANPLQTAAVRYLGSFLIVLPFLNSWRHPGLLRTRHRALQCGRALSLVLATVCSFTALRYMPLTQLTSITFASPLIVALIAGPLLGERIGPRRVVAVLVGFAGMLIVTRPFGGSLHPVAILALVNACACAFYYIMTRRLAAHDQPETTMFYTGAVGALACLPLLPFVWSTPATPREWLVMLALGGFGALSHWLLILAHRCAPASVLAPFFYGQLIGSAFLGWLVFDEQPDRWTVLGGSIVIGSGLYLVYRERVRQKIPSTDVSV